MQLVYSTAPSDWAVGVLWGVVSRICFKLHIAFLCNSHKARSAHVLLAPWWGSSSVVMTQPPLERNPFKKRRYCYYNNCVIKLDLCVSQWELYLLTTVCSQTSRDTLCRLKRCKQYSNLSCWCPLNGNFYTLNIKPAKRVLAEFRSLWVSVLHTTVVWSVKYIYIYM